MKNEDRLAALEAQMRLAKSHIHALEHANTALFMALASSDLEAAKSAPPIMMGLADATRRQHGEEGEFLAEMLEKQADLLVGLIANLYPTT